MANLEIITQHIENKEVMSNSSSYFMNLNTSCLERNITIASELDREAAADGANALSTNVGSFCDKSRARFCHLNSEIRDKILSQ
jgi:hypothetical protein